MGRGGIASFTLARNEERANIEQGRRYANVMKRTIDALQSCRHSIVAGGARGNRAKLPIALILRENQGHTRGSRLKGS